jgi:hypothetical protein
MYGRETIWTKAARPSDVLVIASDDVRALYWIGEAGAGSHRGVILTWQEAKGLPSVTTCQPSALALRNVRCWGEPDTSGWYE